MEKKSLNDLRNAIPSLSGSDKDFAVSIANQWEDRGYISEKQMYWVGSLVNKAAAPKLGQAGLARINALFKAAVSNGLERPKVQIAPGVVLSRAGKNSSRPDSIYIKGGRSYDDVYYGRIDPDGSFSPSGNMVPEVIEALVAWGKNPAEAAKAYGHLVGSCAFCGRRLDDQRSVGVGYGPICAEKYGLPWGEVKADDMIEVAA